MKPATASNSTAIHETMPVALTPAITPPISSTIAPTATINSGKRTRRFAWRFTFSLPAGATRVGAVVDGERGLVVRDQIGHRRGRHIENRLRIDAHQNRDHHQRRQNGDLAWAQVLNGLQCGLDQLTEYDTAI